MNPAYDFIFGVQSLLDLSTEGADAFQQRFDGTSCHHAQLSELEEELAKAGLLQLLDGAAYVRLGAGTAHEGIVTIPIHAISLLVVLHRNRVL